MVARGTPVPKKLKDDCIQEAIFEIKFKAELERERLIGRLSDYAEYSAFEVRRLPVGDIPQALFDSDPNLAYLPTLELVPNEQRSFVVRVGPRVVSYHKMPPYGGWAGLQPKLSKLVEVLFEKAGKLEVTRLGLRYMNVLNKRLHAIQGVSELDLKIGIAGQSVESDLNLSLIVDDPPLFVSKVLVATPRFLTNQLPDGSNVFIDVDVFSPPDRRFSDQEDVVQWLTQAHEIEKREFFHLLRRETIEALEVKSVDIHDRGQ
ncbi:MAG: TIGR04255 family protein [Steroidobacteraceae bacterium]